MSKQLKVHYLPNLNANIDGKVTEVTVIQIPFPLKYIVHAVNGNIEYGKKIRWDDPTKCWYTTDSNSATALINALNVTSIIERILPTGIVTSWATVPRVTAVMLTRRHTKPRATPQAAPPVLGQPIASYRTCPFAVELGKDCPYTFDEDELILEVPIDFGILVKWAETVDIKDKQGNIRRFTMNLIETIPGIAAIYDAMSSDPQGRRMKITVTAISFNKPKTIENDSTKAIVPSV